MHRALVRVVAAPKAHTEVPFGYATSVHGCVEESRDWVASFVIIGCREWRRISNETEDSNEPPERAGRESKNMEEGEEGPEWGACVQLGPFTYHLHTRWRGVLKRYKNMQKKRISERFMDKRV